MGEAVLDLARGRVTYGDLDLCDLDGLVVKKISAEYSPSTLDRLEMLRVVENAGVRVFSRAESILRLINRLSCTVTLRNAGIPMPETRVTEDSEAAVNAVEAFGSAVFKPLYSTKARGMCVLGVDQGRKVVRKEVERFRADHPVMYIQKKLKLGGRDMGLVFLNGEYLGAYARVARDDSWNTTIHSGGRYAACQPEPDLIDMASRAQALFSMDYTTVDVAETDDGPIVFEVSAFGGFRGAKEGIGLDAAELYVQHVLNTLAG
jgi:ribosomal protein S6--L-glutamate ligase